MNRTPYQAPQTSMEHHLLELMEHVRNGTDSRAGFNLAVETAQQHAFWLENEVARQRDEINDLYRKMSPSVTSVTCSSQAIQTGSLCFEWRMEGIQWRGVWMNRPKSEHVDILREVKRRTYREILRLFRSEFERTWKLNVGSK